MSKCLGCGIELQVESEAKEGYAKSLEHTYCKRCFDLIHYNKLPLISNDKNRFTKILDLIFKKNALFLYLIDFFRLSITFNEEVIQKLKDKDVILVVNKIDLLPKSTNLNNIVSFIDKLCQKKNFKPLGIFLISAKKARYFNELLDFVDYIRRNRDVYVVGVANSGKSTFINKIKKNEAKAKEDIATSIIPGTTLLEIPFFFYSDYKAIYDTPGLINLASCEYILDQNYLELLNPASELKPKSYRINDTYVYMLTDLVQITANKEAIIIFYLSEKVIIKTKLIKNTDFYSNKQVFNLANKHKMLFFPGFGFLIAKNCAKLELYTKVKLEVKCYDAFTRGTTTNR